MLCAFALHLAFPQTAWWWIAPFAFAGLIGSWAVLSPRRAALAGYASGLVFFTFGFSWFGETAGALLGPAAPVLDLGPALAEALAFAFAAAVTSIAARRCGAFAFAIASAAAFALAEAARSSGVLGVPLEQIGVAMIDSPLRPLAAYAGVYGITFATALLGASLGWWLLDARDARRARAAAATWIAVAACTALAWTFWPARHAAPPSRRVAAVQGGIAQTLKMTPGGLQVAIERYTAMTRALVPQHPTLILWPETVILAPLDYPRADIRALAQRFAALARETGATLYAGSLAQTTDGAENTLYIFDPRNPRVLDDGSGATARYGKEQLVPFAEYIPGPEWLRRLPFADQIGVYRPAHNAFPTYGGATPLICWESLFGDIAHARLRDDPSLLLVATDDAWFGRTEFPYEHAMAASLRAVESGRWVLRAGATGISGIVAPDGSWTRRTALGGAATVVGEVGPPVDVPYAQLGPGAIALALAGALAIALFGRRPRA
ncbi:hypothetical protein WPS_32570 [Vulcanimicrobium alpinum]|uniref:Apolipoprotein N-acyltransferase n=1 Tax=Vulcanimicrobium alpinum TaxID=3016050 RepID=A0AAN1XZ06_UNVUL|nr:hypothetical protein WPS_32570 [Vulcanimicrobium alpinum]